MGSMSYRPKDLQAFEAKMKEINATKETDPDILRRMIQIERDQAMEIQARLVKERDIANDRIKGLEAACYGITELLEPMPDEMAIGDGYTFAKMKIEKLKAERDALQRRVDLEADSYAYDAIRAKTIKECRGAAFGVPNRSIGRSDDF